jgi:RNA-directed DNA polymerase
MIAKSSIERFKDKVRKITKRNRGVKLETIILELNLLIPGWARYFKLASCKDALTRLDEWIRRKVRCYRLKQFKQGKTILNELMLRGISKASARKVAYSGKGWWRLSITPQVHRAMGIGWTREIGLKSLLNVHISL